MISQVGGFVTAPAAYRHGWPIQPSCNPTDAELKFSTMYREFHRLVLAGALLCTCPAFCQFQVTTGPMPQKVAPTSPTSTPVATTPVTTKPGASGPVEKALDVQAATAWTDTGIILKPGDKVSISGDGNLKFAEGVATPEGLPRTWRDVVRSL